MKKVLVFILSAMITANAHAFAKPEPAQSQITSRDVKSAWENGRRLQLAEFKGQWKYVLHLTSKECTQSEKEKLVYNFEGIKNSFDHSIPALNFTDEIVQESSLRGGGTHRVPSVTFKNLGNKSQNQGPYALEAKEPQFSRWAYEPVENFYPPLSKNEYISYSCRGVVKSRNQIICRLQLHTNVRKIFKGSCEKRGFAYLVYQEE
ncbi:hypothetical protein D3C87_1306790 [compost metagenome]